MGRKSALTPEQWVQVERRHVVDGESVNSLAKEFGVDEAAIRRKINPNKSEQKKGDLPLKKLVQAKIKADTQQRYISEQISELAYGKQQIVFDAVRKLTNISAQLASAAEFGAATAHRLAGIANAQVDKIDDANPMESQDVLQGISALTKMSNEASQIPMGLLAANKEMINRQNEGGNQTNAELLKELVKALPL